MPEWRAGDLLKKFGEINVEADLTIQEALRVVALSIETETKMRLRETTHRYEEPTASSPGHPPSLVSGTLRRSITHDPVHADGAGWVTKVGTANGFYPAYRTKRHGTHTGDTPSSKYGSYLETGDTRNGAAYPFLKPAFDSVYRRDSIVNLMRALGRRRW